MKKRRETNRDENIARNSVFSRYHIIAVIAVAVLFKID